MLLNMKYNFQETNIYIVINGAPFDLLLSIHFCFNSPTWFLVPQRRPYLLRFSEFTHAGLSSVSGVLLGKTLTGGMQHLEPIQLCLLSLGPGRWEGGWWGELGGRGVWLVAALALGVHVSLTSK